MTTVLTPTNPMAYLGGNSVNEEFYLYISLRRIAIEASGKEGAQYLIFNRETEGVKVRHQASITSKSVKKVIYGVIGVIKLILCRYLIVITRRTNVDMGDKRHELSNVWRIEKVNLIPLAPGLKKLSPSQRAQNDKLVNMTLSALNAKDLYYSRQRDLATSTMLSLSAIFRRTGKSPPPPEENTFIWNAVLLNDLLKIGNTEDFCVTIINGFVGVRHLQVHLKQVVLGIVSRRDTRRVGARFFSRGADTTGAVANYVETEMFVDNTSGNVSSFVMLRSSTPLEWAQSPDFSLFPEPYLPNTDHQHLAFYNHFEPVRQKYGDILLIDLSSQVPHGKAIHDLCKQMALSGSGMKFKELNALEPLELKLHEDIMKIGYTAVINKLAVSYQKGIAHVSSLDAVDYTNIAQCRLAKAVFKNMLRFTVGPELYKAPLSQDQILIDELFNELWLENGDALSLHYTGTRSRRGFLLKPIDPLRHELPSDWKLSLQRWYINNMTDGFKQDSLDLITGNVFIRGGNQIGPPYYHKLIQRFLLPAMMTTTTVQMVKLSFEILQGYRSTKQCVCLTIWTLACAATWFIFMRLRPVYTNRPTLITKDAINN